MNISTTRLRRWFAAVGVLVCLLVLGMYFHARHSIQNALNQVPEKLNIQVQQSAQGFTVSRSEQGRTWFKLQASKAVQFKAGGRAELHDVMITIYGRDSSRFDRIYGKTFDYDQQSGNVTSTGEVSIDLQANPQGVTNPDQAAPKELKNPIHLKTTNLVFNQKTGNAWTPALVEFYVPHLSGSAIGANYDANRNVLALQSQVQLEVSGTTTMSIRAQHAVLRKDPREIVLKSPQTESSREHGKADEAILFLRDDNSLDHATAIGNVVISSHHSAGQDRSNSEKLRSAGRNMQITSQRLEIAMRGENQIATAAFSGDVHFKSGGSQSAEGSAGRAVLNFGPGNAVGQIHAEQQVEVVEHQMSGGKPTQDVKTTAPTLDLFLADGNRLTRAETFGAAQIALLPAPNEKGAATHVTADKFTAKFDALGQLSQVHGEQDARVASIALPHANLAEQDRISTSDTIDAYFRPGTGIETLVQQGNFKYVSGTQQAFADRARYTPADQIVTLNGSPRIVDSSMETTATTVRLNRATGEGFAFGDVKTTYNDLKAQPNGALLASSNPIHVTSENMAAHNRGFATYRGNVRLWQNANMIEAPTVQFQKDQRVVIAASYAQQKVSTDLISVDNKGKTTPVYVTANHLSYYDSQRKAHYEGAVIVQSTDMTMTCQQMDVFFASKQSVENRTSLPGALSRQTTAAPQISTAQAQLDKIIASGSVLITQPNRRATGDQLVYTAADDKFVVTGGPPVIFDVEHGRTTGASLTLYRNDNRVLIEGDKGSPAVTQTRTNRIP
ncbi:MAG TPA: LPS export ABC transporter periplasmic protein LptC [Terriglobales bacterium]|nr:LPS export ABC transporter periplasmic protein LptC [Terriglobales bacterium]